MKIRTLVLFLVAVSMLVAGCDMKVRMNLNSKILEPHEQELTYAYGTDAVLLDPAVVTDEESFKVARNLYETLVKFGETDMTIHSSLLERPSFNLSFLAMTLTRRPFGDPKIREAISYAINREAIVTRSFNSQAILAKNPMQPTSFAYNEDTKAYVYDVEKAKQLLGASTYDGSIIELWTMDTPRPYMPDGMAAAKQIQKDLQAIGFNTKIITHDWKTYLEKTTNGEAQLFILGGTSDNGDPDNLLSLFFDKTGALNKTRLDDKKIQNWLKLARETTNQTERKEYYDQIQQRLRELIPLVPLVHSTPVVGVSEAVQNYVPHPTGSDDFLTVSKE